MQRIQKENCKKYFFKGRKWKWQKLNPKASSNKRKKGKTKHAKKQG